MFETISLANSERWNEIICSMQTYDFYFLSEYQCLERSGRPLLLHYSNDGDALALPIVMREISGASCRDVTSVYGYCGPLSSPKPKSSSINGFRQAIRDFFDASDVVCAFSRLHPLFPFQTALLQDFGEVSESNLTVAIDLTLPISEQKRQYARSTKYAINKLQRKGFSLKIASTQAEIKAFVAIYAETMDRVGAASAYYFPPDYFEQILKTLDSFIMLAMYENKIVSGSLCVCCNNILQVHLNATLNEYLTFSPQKLVMDGVRNLGVERGLKIMHLGGGFHGGNDSLFTFKSRFSSQYYPFKVWKYIHNPAVYNDLATEAQRKGTGRTDYFPEYRGR